MLSIVAPLALGIAFGWSLQKGGLTQYHRIANVFRFTDLTVLKFLLTALVVGAVLVQALVSLRLAGSFVPVAPTYLAGNALGGLFVGAGMALSGFCPGTVVAGAAEGRLDYAVPGVAGLFAGALLFGWSYPKFFPALARLGAVGPVTIPHSLGVNAWLFLALLAECTAILFYAIERGPLRARKT